MLSRDFREYVMIFEVELFGLANIRIKKAYTEV